MLVFVALNHAGAQRANERMLDGRFEPLVTEIGKVETKIKEAPAREDSNLRARPLSGGE
jgi:hypothetical protein